MNAIISSLAVNAADNALVEKLASDTQISPDLVCHLAGLVQMSPHAFVKAAYANPAEYVQFLKEAAMGMQTLKGGINAIGSGLKGLKDRVLGGGSTPGEIANVAGRTGQEHASNLAGDLNSSGVLQGSTNKLGVRPPEIPPESGGLLGRLFGAARGKAGTPEGGYFWRSSPTLNDPNIERRLALNPQNSTEVTGNRFDRLMARGALGGSRAGRNAQVALPLGAVGVSAATKGSDPSVGATDAAGAGLSSGAGSFGDGAGGDFGGSSESPTKVTSPASSTSPVAKGGMSPALKALLAAGGIGAGALGVGALASRNSGNNSKKKKKEVRSSDSITEVARQAIIKIAAAEYRKEAADRFCSYLDTVVAHMPLEKAASVRRLQAGVSAGQPLSHAIKLAYPQLNGEQRGILAARLVKAAANDTSAFKTKKISGRQEFSVKMKDGAVDKMKEMSN